MDDVKVSAKRAFDDDDVDLRDIDGEAPVASDEEDDTPDESIIINALTESWLVKVSNWVTLEMGVPFMTASKGSQIFNGKVASCRQRRGSLSKDAYYAKTVSKPA